MAERQIIGSGLWSSIQAPINDNFEELFLRTNDLDQAKVDKEEGKRLITPAEGVKLANLPDQFVEAVQDIVAQFFVAGANIEVTYDDVNNTLTITGQAGGGGVADPEVIRDTIGATLVGSGNINVVVDDTANTITISTTATVNSTDAHLLNRANHTGTQPASTIADLTEAVQDIVGSFLGAGSNINVTYNDSLNTITISGTGGTSDPEAIRDAIGAALIGVGLINIVVNDAGDTITISTTATQNISDAASAALMDQKDQAILNTPTMKLSDEFFEQSGSTIVEGKTVPVASLKDNSLTEVKLHPDVQTKLNSGGGGGITVQDVIDHLKDLPGWQDSVTVSLRGNFTWAESGTNPVQLATSTLSHGAVTETSIVLNWTAVTNATGYILQRSADGATGWSSIYTGSALTFTDSGLTAGTQYFYRISATAPGYTSSNYASHNVTTSTAGGSYILEQAIKINFANEWFGETQAGRNEFKPTVAQATTDGGYSMALLDINSAATGITAAIGFGFDGAANDIAAASGGACIYPDGAINSGFLTSSDTDPATIVFTGLDDTKFYHFYLLTASGSAGTQVRYYVNGLESNNIYHTTADNYPLTANGDKYTNPAIVRVYNVQPEAGEISIMFRKANTDAPFSQPAINMMEIERSNIAKV